MNPLQSSLRFLIALVVLAAASLQTVHAQPSDPADMLREFYGWYVTALKADKDPFTDSRKELQRFVTPRLLKQIDKARKSGEISSDPILEAQDFDKDWAKNITVSKPNISGKTATANVQLKGAEMGTHKLRVTMQQDGDNWKVDKVDGL